LLLEIPSYWLKNIEAITVPAINFFFDHAVKKTMR